MDDLFAFANRNAPPEDIPSEVAALFERLALQVAQAGHSRYSADAVLHRIRWHMHIERGDREFKCNDHWTAPLSRWFLAKHPELPKFFETRVRRSQEAA
jgi:hypothetical protein